MEQCVDGLTVFPFFSFVFSPRDVLVLLWGFYSFFSRSKVN